MRKTLLSGAVNDIDDRYIGEAINELNKYNSIISFSPKEGKNMSKKILGRVAVALFYLSIFSGSISYAYSRFVTNYKNIEQSETFMISWVGQDGEEQNVECKDAEIAFSFEGCEESKEIEFKENWLPAEPNEKYILNAQARSQDGYRIALTSEYSVDDCIDYLPLYNIQIFYAAKYVNDGALVLKDYVPGEILQEEKDNYKVIKFSSDYKYGRNDITNYYMLVDEDRGYIIVVSGIASMDEIEKIANNLDVRETGNTLNSENYYEYVELIDCGRG